MDTDTDSDPTDYSADASDAAITSELDDDLMLVGLMDVESSDDDPWGDVDPADDSELGDGGIGADGGVDADSEGFGSPMPPDSGDVLGLLGGAATAGEEPPDVLGLLGGPSTTGDETGGDSQDDPPHSDAASHGDASSTANDTASSDQSTPSNSLSDSADEMNTMAAINNDNEQTTMDQLDNLTV